MISIPTFGDVVGGKYRVIRVLGQGGMGAVLEAEHELTKKRVAIKWMHPQIASDADARARFVREAQASARVRHPNIVDVYDVVNEGDALFLVMELLDGETLTALLQRGGTPLHELIAILLPALRAVSAAHRQGVVHRDLKPDNIFLAQQADSARPITKVLDFGISKVSDASALTLTRTGAAMGTPMYMSVEQLCGDRDLDARADIYSLGVILYEAVTGRAPFEAETFSELAIKVATVEPRAPKQLRPDLPSALAALIGACMAKKREQRLGSVDELIRGLEPFASEQSFRANMTHANHPMPAVPGESLAPPPTSQLSPARSVEAAPTFSRSPGSSPPLGQAAARARRPMLAAFGLAALVVAGGIGVFLLRHAEQPAAHVKPVPVKDPPAAPPPPPAAALSSPSPTEPLAITPTPPKSEDAPPVASPPQAPTPQAAGKRTAMPSKAVPGDRVHPRPRLLVRRGDF